jgi:hypothetical protein
MQALRQIKTTDNDFISIKIPRAFQRRKLEIIIIPVNEKASYHDTESTWPRGFFDRTSGCFEGTPLVREEPGEYEVRNEIL